MYRCFCWTIVSFICFIFFFFKQKTAYEMRISDWSSDVCSSDLSISFFNTESVSDLVHLFRIPLANSNQVRLRMPLINGDEFSAETQADNGNIDLLFFHRNEFMSLLRFNLL